MELHRRIFTNSLRLLKTLKSIERRLQWTSKLCVVILILMIIPADLDRR